MNRAFTILVCLLFLASALGMSAVVIAPPPDKCEPWPECRDGGEEPPPPTGTIYFSYNDGSGIAIWTMQGDGSEKTKQPVDSCLDHWYDNYFEAFGEVSRIKHGDHYWYVRFCVIADEFYPDGLPRKEAFAIRDDNAITVQLTNNPLLAPNHRSLGPYWTPDDASISWGAKTWVCDPDCYLDDAQAGIFVATVNLDPNTGDISGAEEPTLIWWTELRLNTDGYWHPRTGHNHHWSPDGTKFVWQRGGIQVVDLTLGIETWIASGYTPRWSPDGTKIAFDIGHDQLKTINPDGSNEQVIWQGKSNKRSHQEAGNARWSTDSEYVSFTMREINERDWSVKVWLYRVGVNGEDPTSLTKDLPTEGHKGNVAWR